MRKYSNKIYSLVLLTPDEWTSFLSSVEIIPKYEPKYDNEYLMKVERQLSRFSSSKVSNHLVIFNPFYRLIHNGVHVLANRVFREKLANRAAQSI